MNQLNKCLQTYRRMGRSTNISISSYINKSKTGKRLSCVVEEGIVPRVLDHHVIKIGIESFEISIFYCKRRERASLLRFLQLHDRQVNWYQYQSKIWNHRFPFSCCRISQGSTFYQKKKKRRSSNCWMIHVRLRHIIGPILAVFAWRMRAWDGRRTHAGPCNLEREIHGPAAALLLAYFVSFVRSWPTKLRNIHLYRRHRQKRRSMTRRCGQSRLREFVLGPLYHYDDSRPS